MKFKNNIVPLILIICLLLPSNNVSASIIEQETDKDGIKTYYVSTRDENFLVFSMIGANMDETVKIVYSGEMLSLSNSYLGESVNYRYMPQNKVYRSSFWVGTYYSYSLTQSINDNNTITARYDFSYRQTQEQTKYMYDKIHEAIKENISNLKTEYQKAKWAYQWVIDNIHYDKTYEKTSAYDGFTDSGTVCSGYASLYSAVATELGLECAYVSGTTRKEKISHAWNIIKINNLWYCVDTTWGDSEYGDKFLLKSKGTLASDEYGNHVSKLYDIYINNGEEFSKTDFDKTDFSRTYGVLPSVYDINLDMLKYNVLSKGEVYNYLIENPNDVDIKFISTNKKVAKINKDGVVTAVGIGTTKIIAINKKLNFIQTCEIKVEK